MRDTKRIILSKSCFALFILFAIYGCQTTDNVNTPKTSVSNLKSDKIQPDLPKEELVVKTTNTMDKDTVQSKEDEELEKAHIEKFQKRLFGMMGGHGGNAPQDTNEEDQAANQEQTVNSLSVKPAKSKKRPFEELEKRLYGNWINDLKTESYEFHDDGTVLINVTGQRSKSHTLNGNYVLLKEDRIKFDFENDSFARQMPARYYKITMSDNEFVLIDEPKKSGGPDGPTTKYKRIK